jgi:hypothetical protein
MARSKEADGASQTQLAAALAMPAEGSVSLGLCE